MDALIILRIVLATTIDSDALPWPNEILYPTRAKYYAHAQLLACFAHAHAIDQIDFRCAISTNSYIPQY